MGKKFDLAAAVGNLPDVSDSGTGRKQLSYLSIVALDSDANNFYELSGIDELAANIQLCGLQQPLVVRPGAMEGRWTIVSGHRRAAALSLLVEEGHEEFASVPCLIDDSDASPALQELRLIMANSDTRRMSDADLSKQAERVEALFYQLSEEGYSFPGRMRDHVAEACQVSKTKLATLKVIRENLVPDLYKLFEKKRITTDGAYRLAHLTPELQQRVLTAVGGNFNGCYINEVERKAKNGADYGLTLTCPDGKACTHGDAFIRHDLKSRYSSCGGTTCCLQCSAATRDWSPCGNMCAKAKEKRKSKKAKQDAKDQEEKEKRLAKIHARTSARAARFVRAADAAGVPDTAKVQVRYNNEYSIADLRKWAEGDFSAKDTRDYYGNDETPLDFRYIDELLKTQKVLGCSFEYLLGLTDELTPSAAAPSAGWQTGTPPEAGWYVGVFYFTSSPLCNKVYWDGESWRLSTDGETVAATVTSWMPLPPRPELPEEGGDDA